MNSKTATFSDIQSSNSFSIFFCSGLPMYYRWMSYYIQIRLVFVTIGLYMYVNVVCFTTVPDFLWIWNSVNFFIHFHRSSGMHVKSVFTSAMKRVLASTKYASLWSDWRKKSNLCQDRQLKINKLVTGTLSHQELYDWQHKVPPMASDPKKVPTYHHVHFMGKK